MIKIRKKILAVLLTAAMLVSMSSLVAWSDEQPATDDGTSQTEQTTDDGASADDKQDDKKDDKKDDQDRQWYGECLPYEQCRLLCEGYSQSRDHSRIEEDHL